MEDRTFLAEVSAMLLRYRVQPPPKKPVILYGASNFGKWETAREDMLPFECLNHGFGGSTDIDLIKYYKKLVARFEPYAVVVNSSQNDLTAFGDEQILQNKDKLLSLLRESLPETRLVLMSVIRAPAFRTGRVDTFDRSVKELCRKRMWEFCDISSLFDDNCFCDNSHLNAEGYKRLSKRIKETLFDGIK